MGSLAFTNHPWMALSTSQLHRPLLMHVMNLSVSVTCSIKPPAMEQFYKHSVFKTRICCSKDEIRAFYPQVENVAVQSKEKLWALFPDSVKRFPWEKAESVAVLKLLVWGKEALKWSLFVLFFLSSSSDIIYSISTNKELVIPFGLFFGCMMTDFLKETSREILLNSKERHVTWQLLVISCFFVLLKSVSFNYPVGLRVFLCHAANGGVLQVLWHYRDLVREDKDDIDNLQLEKTSMSKAAEGQAFHQIEPV